MFFWKKLTKKSLYKKVKLKKTVEIVFSVGEEIEIIKNRCC